MARPGVLRSSLERGLRRAHVSDGYRSKFETGMSVSVFFNFEHRYFGMGSVFNRALDDSVFWY
jgi:hypothetical protein